MSEIDDIEDGGADGDGGEGPTDAPSTPGERPATGADVDAPACLSCGGPVSFGAFCPWCGQKNDDMRRSSLLLTRDFLRDTFGFDSRMWRTLGLIAVVPGAVAMQYAGGKRSRFTPPVRLFLVISFLFFLVLALTNTMIAAVEVTPTDKEDVSIMVELGDDNTPSEDGSDAKEEKSDCAAKLQLSFFKRSQDLDHDAEFVERCAADMRSRISAEDVDGDEEALETVVKAFDGVTRAIEDPARFNREMANWLPRLMLAMTPVLALILALFLRGRDALLFDHAVFSLYAHAGAFLIVGAALLAAQFGAPGMALAAPLALFVHYFVGLKRAYKRGWIKTTWTAIASGGLYMFVLTIALFAIVSKIMLDG